MSRNRHNNQQSQEQNNKEALKRSLISQKQAHYELLYLLENESHFGRYLQPVVSANMTFLQGFLPFYPLASVLLQEALQDHYRLRARSKTLSEEMKSLRDELDHLERLVPSAFEESRRRYEFLARQVFLLEQAARDVDAEIASAQATVHATPVLTQQLQQHLTQQLPSVLSQILVSSKMTQQEILYGRDRQHLQQVQQQSLRALLHLSQATARKMALEQLIQERRALRDERLRSLCITVNF